MSCLCGITEDNNLPNKQHSENHADHHHGHNHNNYQCHNHAHNHTHNHNIHQQCDTCQQNHQHTNPTLPGNPGLCQRHESHYTAFVAAISPISNLKANDHSPEAVEFLMRRKNKTITLQWEPFEGSLAMTGVTHLRVLQTIGNVPPHKISYPIFIDHKGITKVTRLEIDPDSKNHNIKFYINTNGSSTDTQTGDSIYVHGGCVSWIIN